MALVFVVAGGGPDGLAGGFIGGLAFGLGTGVFFWLIAGLTGRELTTKMTPNQGIWRSVENALRIGMMSGLSAGLIFGVTFGLGLSAIDGLSYGLGATCIAALLGGLFYGGYAALSHLVLRSVLWHHGVMPLELRPLPRLLRRADLPAQVGGGYIFIHRMLMEYFASLDTIEYPARDNV